ncbi:DUF4236 domain-containing protein, partial [Pseudomonas aeruginosa]|uniref:DUF4236 domain-containing protein n=1 Tax=Pseudomonas aeruginosa TaxID=287 RepID=UPI0020CCB6CA
MGFRFSKRITIVPGVRLNISGSGISTSVGPRGLGSPPFSRTLTRRPIKAMRSVHVEAK